MNDGQIGTLLLMVVLLALSAFFSALETAFSTFNKLKIKSLAQDGNKKAILILQLDETYDKVLTTVLIGNNIVNLALSSIATLFFIDLLKNVSTDGAKATISTAVITVLVLLFGEISPKVIARQHADTLMLNLVYLLQAILVLFTPFSFIFGAWSKLITKLFHAKEDVVTEDELMTIVDEAEEDGTIESDEGELIRSAIEFNDVSAGDILTPRVDVCAIVKGEKMERIAEVFMDNGFSRLPVYDGDLDHIVGILHEKDFFTAYHNNNKTVTKYLQKPVFVSEHIKIPDLLQVLKTKKCHMAIVVDEFGGTMGIVTMEDIIEELIGDVFDEHDEIVNDYQQLTDDTYLVKASADLDDFLEKFALELPEDDDMPQTVNGLLMKKLESFPKVGDQLTLDNLLIEIEKIGQKRVEEIKVTVLPKENENDEA